jgi:hypothetical protein
VTAGEAKKITYRTTIVSNVDEGACFLPVEIDPVAAFGKVRAPVRVTVNGYTYASTIASMGNGPCIPLRRSNREAAGLTGTETLDVTLELDTAARVVEPPKDLANAMKARPPALARWQELSYSHQREHADAIAAAVKPETRARRIEKAVEHLLAMAPKARRAVKRAKR